MIQINGAFNLSNVTVKTIKLLKKITISLNSVLFNFLFIKEYWKMCMFSTKILSTVLNTYVRMIFEGSFDTT